MESKTIQTETYSAYQKRIQELVCCRACFPPENEWLATSPGLQQKFDAGGAFRNFYGDTVVFPLPEDGRQFLQEIQTALYHLSGEMLSTPLPADTMHITLHDLCASPSHQEMKAAAASHSAQIWEKLSAAKSMGPVCLSARGMVSMVSSSIVMLFAPASKADYDTVQDMYARFDEICPLPYPLTLHCTLAYYKPGSYPPERWNGLYRFIRQWNEQHLDEARFTLDSGRIEYQFFSSMRHYKSVFGGSDAFGRR